MFGISLKHPRKIKNVFVKYKWQYANKCWSGMLRTEQSLFYSLCSCVCLKIKNWVLFLKCVSIKYSNIQKSLWILKEKYWNMFLWIYNPVQTKKHYHLSKSSLFFPWPSICPFFLRDNFYSEFCVITPLFFFIVSFTTSSYTTLHKWNHALCWLVSSTSILK